MFVLFTTGDKVKCVYVFLSGLGPDTSAVGPLGASGGMTPASAPALGPAVIPRAQPVSPFQSKSWWSVPKPPTQSSDV